jgi:two-component system cell cycle sensor histidine kinase/response regulator CckA
MQLAPHLPSLNADVTQLRQVIMNLIVNASEAVGGQNGAITVTTSAQLYDLAGLADNLLHDPLPEGRYVCLEIADTGCGMDKETMVKMFDPFFTTKFTGRGLGLPTVLGIVRGHQGAIKAHSQIGHGATFQILLPAAERATAADFSAKPPQTVWHGEGTILLVDDEDGVRITGKRMLERLGFQVLTASHGREALVVFQQHPDDIRCVLLDLTMPHMDGEETLRELRKISPDVRVIMASGYDEQEINKRFNPADLAGFVHKPFSLDHLARALQGATSAAPTL